MSITNPPLLPGVVLALQGTVVQGPEGPQGADGLSAYEVWKLQGNTGTAADFIASLIGPTGEEGKPVELQKSATHVQWRLQGDAAWINLIPLVDLKGADGINGTNGLNGSNGLDGIDGQDGADGRSVVSILRVDGNGAPGTVDTFQITYSTGAPSFFTVTHGANGLNGANGANGANGTNGRGIATIARTAGTGAAGTIDTYTITYTDATTSSFSVYNGADGAGAGDMLKSIYDPNNDGKVTSAENADSVPWSGVTSKPAVIAAGVDAAAARTAIDAEAAIAATTADKYFAGNKTWVDFATSVRASVLTGLSLASNAVIAAGDSVLVAFGKLQKQISDHIGAGGSAHATVTAGGAAGFMSGAAMTKLDGIASGATANSTDAYLLARGNHTGTQLLSTIAQSGATDGQLAKWSQANARWEPATVSAGGGLTTVRVTGTTASYTAAVGENVSIESTVAVTVSAPPGLTAGQKWGVMVCNDRWDNVVNMNGNKHENLSDATMTLKSNKVVVEFEMINPATFGQKVKIL